MSASHSDPPAAQHAQEPPQRIAQRYRVLQQLGEGGMGTVFRVFDEGNGREVALKQLRPSEKASRQAKLTALFEREFVTLAQLAHPAVIEVYDYGIDGGAAY